MEHGRFENFLMEHGRFSNLVEHGHINFLMELGRFSNFLMEHGARSMVASQIFRWSMVASQIFRWSMVTSQFFVEHGRFSSFLFFLVEHGRFSNFGGTWSFFEKTLNCGQAGPKIKCSTKI